VLALIFKKSPHHKIIENPLEYKGEEDCLIDIGLAVKSCFGYLNIEKHT
jgi:hypothetical protein